MPLQLSGANFQGSGANLQPAATGLQAAVSALPTISEWARKVLDFHPNPSQAEILDCADSHVILCCTRQFGKSTLTALKAVHHALTRPGAQVIVAAPSERQSAEFLRKAAAFLRHVEVPAKAAGAGLLGFSLPNGARLLALPASTKTVRGFSAVSLLIFEEAAFVPDELYQAVTPMQAAVADPRLWLISTPGGHSGFFYEEWSDQARTHWRRFRIPASQCPHIAPEFLAMERIRKGDVVYRREYECEFVAAETQIISRELWDAALDENDKPFNGGKPLWRD